MKNSLNHNTTTKKGFIKVTVLVDDIQPHGSLSLQSTVTSAHTGSVTSKQQHGGVGCFHTLTIIYTVLESDQDSTPLNLSQISVASCKGASEKSGDTLHPQMAAFPTQTVSPGHKHVMYTHPGDHSGSAAAGCCYSTSPQ